MLMDVARDFVNAPENFKTIQFHLELAVTSWNIACVECATTRKILLNDFLKNFKGKYTRKQVISLKTDIQRFIAKKDAIHPKERCFIVDAHLEAEGDDDRIYVAAISHK